MTHLTSNDAASPDTPRARMRLLEWVLRLLGVGPVLILVVLCLVLWQLEPVFFTTFNVQNILVQSSVVAVLAIGSLMVIVTGGIDLSIGSTMALATVVGWHVFQQWKLGGALTIVAMVALGLVVGLVNGIVYVKGRVPHSFIVTLAMLSIAQSIGLWWAKGQPLPGMPDVVGTLGNGYVGVVPVPALVVGAVALLSWVYLRWTQWGRWTYATGGSAEAASRMSIPVSRVLISSYALCGLLAGVAGILVAGSINGASSTIGQGAGGLLDAVAAVIIGGASILGGRGSVWDCLVGALLIGVIRNGLALLNFSPYLEGLLVGATILLAVELDVLRTGLERRIRAMQANEGAA
jgi:ribose transport system permease protein